MATETAILAGGCFWGAQDLMRRRPGVISTQVGYSGGDTPNATYRNHGDHAEAVEIVYDPEVISFRELLEFFFQIHDPSTRDRQGNDRGRSYRSAIFYTSDEQKRVALDTIADVDASGLWPGRVVTEVAAAGPFWTAEEDHQDYLVKYPNGYTCHFVRPGWVLPHRQADPRRLMRADIRQALDIDGSSTLEDRTIDITTTGRRSGAARRIEIVFYRLGDDLYLSGIPAPRRRDWLANLAEHPEFTFHLKRDVVADLPATATVIDDPAERRRVLGAFVEAFNGWREPDSPWPEAVLDEWVAHSPLARIDLADVD